MNIKIASKIEFERNWADISGNMPVARNIKHRNRNWRRKKNCTINSTVSFGNNFSFHFAITKFYAIETFDALRFRWMVSILTVDFSLTVKRVFNKWCTLHIFRRTIKFSVWKSLFQFFSMHFSRNQLILTFSQWHVLCSQRSIGSELMPNTWKQFVHVGNCYFWFRFFFYFSLRPPVECEKNQFRKNSITRRTVLYLKLKAKRSKFCMYILVFVWFLLQIKNSLMAFNQKFVALFIVH